MNAPAPAVRPPPTMRRQFAALSALGLILVAGNILYAGCASSSAVGPTAGDAHLRRNGQAQLRKPPAPESEWNSYGFWVRVQDKPALYVPRAYGRTLPRVSAAGEWFTDPRDGKKLFVPKGGAGNLSEGALRGEAVKITCWHDGRSIPGVQDRPLKEFISR